MSQLNSMAAASPFLSVDQVAHELGILPAAVRRLIAIKSLDAIRTRPETGEWKILPAALEAFMRAGSPRMDIPRFDQHDLWYDDRDLIYFGQLFVQGVRATLTEKIPIDTVSIDGAEAGGNYERVVTGAPLAAVTDLGEKPAGYWNMMANAPKSPFKTAAEQFLAFKLMAKVSGATKPTVTAATYSEASNWLTLFDSPESYRSILDTAWEGLRKERITLRRQFKVEGGRREGFATIEHVVPYVIFSGKLSVIEPLLF